VLALQLAVVVLKGDQLAPELQHLGLELLLVRGGGLDPQQCLDAGLRLGQLLLQPPDLLAQALDLLAGLPVFRVLLLQLLAQPDQLQPIVVVLELQIQLLLPPLVLAQYLVLFFYQVLVPLHQFLSFHLDPLHPLLVVYFATRPLPLLTYWRPLLFFVLILWGFADK
jgi:hypothetical protein